MTLGVLVPLLGILAALAWGATHLVNGTTRSWFERDVSMRARRVASGARDALATQARTGALPARNLCDALRVREETNR